MSLFKLDFGQAEDSIGGYVLRDSQANYRFFWADKKTTFQLRPATPEVAELLGRLEHLDALRGLATLNTGVNGPAMTLSSVDFVGLRRLIGDWQGTNTLIQFTSFQEVSVYTSNSSGLSRKVYRYAITPGVFSGLWKLFLSDDNQVILANLALRDETHANLSFLDSKTGEVTRVLFLTKGKAPQLQRFTQPIKTIK